jgi:transposase InsO family protein
VIAKAVALKKRVPQRPLNRIIQMLEADGLVAVGQVKRSTLHRALQDAGVSRQPRVPDAQDLDRFEAAAPNDLWQSDMLVGPWLPDPSRAGKVRRTWLYAFLDDHSRLLLHGRFSFKGDLPALELVFRRALQKYGVCKRVYYDNGQVYRSTHMKQIAAMLGIHRILHTRPYRPQGHGKIEALNRLMKRSFIAEVPDSRIRTLEELNTAFVAWMHAEYNTQVHGSTQQAPLDRWRAGIDGIRYADDERLRQAFLWKETRKADKSGVLSLFGTQYQVGPALAGRRLEVRFDPEDLVEIEIWREGRLQERARPLQLEPWRRPSAEQAPAAPDVTEPVGDFLGHLVAQHQVTEPSPRAWKEDAERRRHANTDAIVAVLRDHLDGGAFDEVEARAWLARFGPLDAGTARSGLQALLQRVPADMHVRFYLDHLRESP